MFITLILHQKRQNKVYIIIVIIPSQGQQYSSYRLREDVDVVSHLQLVGGSSLVQQSISVSNVPEANDMFSLHMYFLKVLFHLRLISCLI